jgi:hypothetical protein
MLYERDDLDFDKLTLRIDFTFPFLDYEIDATARQLREKHGVYMDNMRYEYETPRIIRTTGKVYSGVPEYIVKSVRKKFHLWWDKKPFQTEYILDMQIAVLPDGTHTITFGPFGA